MKYVVLDIGNVIAKLDFNNFNDTLSYEVNISKKDANDFLLRIQKDHDLGLVDFKKELNYLFDIKSESKFNKLLAAWDNILEINYDMLAVIDLLHKRKVRLGIMSNMGNEHKHLLETKLGTYVGFSNMVKHYSCDVGARKPQKLFFQSFLFENPQFEGALYIDDIQENLDAGKKAGFETHMFNLHNHHPVALLNDTIIPYLGDDF